ncbi:unnamed protein product, partial [Effrenium voratum]
SRWLKVSAKCADRSTATRMAYFHGFSRGGRSCQDSSTSAVSTTAAASQAAGVTCARPMCSKPPWNGAQGQCRCGRCQLLQMVATARATRWLVHVGRQPMEKSASFNAGHAGDAGQAEKRTAPDGSMYSRVEFMEYYGRDGAWRWCEAALRDWTLSLNEVA